MTYNPLVIDASTTLKWVFEEEIDVPQAKQLLKDWLSREIELITPSLWQYEILNSLKSAVLKSPQITPLVALNKLKTLIKFQPTVIPIESILESCLENSIKLGISGYDSVYITLAVLSRSPLITADQKLVNKISNPRLAISLKDYYNKAN